MGDYYDTNSSLFWVALLSFLLAAISLGLICYVLKLFSSCSSYHTNLLYLLWYDIVFIAYCLLLAGGWALYASYWWEAGTSLHSTLSRITPIHHQECAKLVKSCCEHGVQHSMSGDKLFGIILLAIPAIQDISLMRSHLSWGHLSFFLSWDYLSQDLIFLSLSLMRDISYLMRSISQESISCEILFSVRSYL